VNPAPPPAAVAPASPLAKILAGESATAALNAWCAAQHLPPVTAHLAPDVKKPAPPAVTALLGSKEPLRFRHVALLCGEQTVSTADNWYVPAQLTAEMNQRLDTSDTPFGQVVKPLGFTRRTLDVQHLAGGWEVKAVLTSAGGAPFSYVVEDYAPAIK
jgi:hypothetical protein